MDIPPPKPPRPAALPDFVSGVAVSDAAAVLCGAAAGFVWGGIGGRIAMRVLFLTSDDAVRGMTSDDGFKIGQISAASVFLLIAMTVLGGILGAGYGLLRMALRSPIWVTATGVAIALGAGVGGGLIVSPDGVDFRVLEPLWLAVALFVFLPAVWGATVAVTTERLLHHPSIASYDVGGIDARPLGRYGDLVAWAGLATITVLGLVNLVNDLNELVGP